MKFISHRGNLLGKKPELENTKNYIAEAISKGFEVEVDVWKIGDRLFLAHDAPIPKNLIGFNFFEKWKDVLWCHAKNIEALQFLMKSGMHCFWHQTDEYTLTSQGFVWAYPAETFAANTIAVLPEQYNLIYMNIYKCYGICSDFIQQYERDYRTL